MNIALTRAVSPRIGECELSFLPREPIDAARAAAQHEAYEQCLQSLGCTIVRVEPLPDHPDGVFVEDAAIVLDEFAVITRPGAESRRGETESVGRALQPYRELHRIESPATLDGGDVLRIDRTLYVGLSLRTSEAAISQLRRIATGYQVRPVAFSNCLHLKSAVTQIAPRTLLLNPEWLDVAEFGGFEIIAVDEPHAANALRLGGTILLASAHVRTRRTLEQRGFAVVGVAMGELVKAEAGVTCCSLIV
jgi:dimethylargininase